MNTFREYGHGAAMNTANQDDVALRKLCLLALQLLALIVEGLLQEQRHVTRNERCGEIIQIDMDFIVLLHNSGSFVSVWSTPLGESL